MVPLSPRIEGKPPAAVDAAGYLRHTAGTDLRLDWWVGDTPPVGAHRMLLLLRHFRGSEAVLFGALACMPTEAGTLTVPAHTLAALTVDTEGGDIWIAAQVDAAWYAAEEGTPRGDIRRAGSVTTWGDDLSRLTDLRARLGSPSGGSRSAGRSPRLLRGVIVLPCTPPQSTTSAGHRSRRQARSGLRCPSQTRTPSSCR